MTDSISSRSSAFFEALSEPLSEALPSYLSGRRWFGDKAREIDSARVLATFPIAEIEAPAAFLVVEVSFSVGDPARYAIPIVVSNDFEGEFDTISKVEIAGECRVIRDALLDAGFRAWLLDILIDGHELDAGHGRLVFDRIPGADVLFSGLKHEPSRVLGVEQSNSSIVFGLDAIIKLFRRLQPGVNPDVELSRFLTARARFANVPRYLGSIAYEPYGGESTVVAVAQEFIESSGDGWNFVLELLRRHLPDNSSDTLLEESIPVARRLGDVTAGMHLALASDPWAPDLAPEVIHADDAARWSAEYLSMLDTIAVEMRRVVDKLDARSADLAATFLDLAPGLRKRTVGFERLIGRQKIRVHGDYHLGQLLHRMDGDFAVIDFEGEPQRKIVERRGKMSPLKDVAGMLRSFSYARGTATGWLSETGGLLASDLVAWERTMRREFLHAYVAAAGSGEANLLPASTGDLQSAVSAWELDKAVYEVQYELNNRPDWLWIPLSAMLKQGEPDV